MLTVDTSLQNGPIHVLANGSWVLNNFSWNHLADTIWIDQPVGMCKAHLVLARGLRGRPRASQAVSPNAVMLPLTGTGFSTADSTGYGASVPVPITGRPF